MYEAQVIGNGRFICEKKDTLAQCREFFQDNADIGDEIVVFEILECADAPAAVLDLVYREQYWQPFEN